MCEFFNSYHYEKVVELAEALKLSDEEWESRFRFRKPRTEEEIICYCRTGARGEKACQLLRTLGYNRAYNYEGSSMEWLFYHSHFSSSSSSPSSSHQH